MKKLDFYLTLLLLFLLTATKTNAQYFNYNWANNMGMLGPGEVAVYGSCVDAQHHYYTVGKIDGTVDTDPSVNYNYLNGGNTGNGYNGFFAEYDSAGILVRSLCIGGLAKRTSFSAIAIASNGDIIVSGAFKDSSYLEPNNPFNVIYQTTANISGESFIAKYDHSLNLIWVKTFPNTNLLNPEKIEVDGQDNIFVSGVFDFSVDIDPSPAIHTLSTYPSGSFYKDVFLAKFNTDGTLNWAKNMGSENTDNVGDIALDATGNIYIGNTYGGQYAFLDSTHFASSLDGNFISVTKFSNAGVFSWNKDVSAGSGTIEVYDIVVNPIGEVFFTGKMYGSFYFQFPTIYRGSGTSTTCDYLAKLTVNGDCVWANSGYGDPSVGYTLALDTLSQVYLSGIFSGTKDFDHTAGVANVTSSPATSVNYYLASYDSSGNYRWASKLAATGTAQVPDMRVSKTNKLWMEGDYAGTCDFDPGAGTNSITVPAVTNFVTTYALSGTYISAFAFKGCGSVKDRVTAIDASINGSIVTAGIFSGEMDFDLTSSAYVLTSSADSNAYFASYSSAAGTLNWVNQIKGKAIITALTRNNADEIYVTGYYTGVTYFDLNTPGFYLNTSSNNIDIFFGKYNVNGVLQWMHNFGSAYTDQGLDITIDNNGNVIMTGIFVTLIDFDPSATGTFNLTTPQFTTNGYVAKYDGDGNFITAFKIVGSISNNVQTDNNNNIIVNGTFHGFGNFDVVGGNAIIYATGGSADDDYFIAKYDSLGIYQWALKVGSEGSNKFGSDIAIDDAGNIFIAACLYAYNDTADLDPSATIFPVDASAGIVAKYSSSGNFIFGFSTGVGRMPVMDLDNNGNATIASRYIISYDIDPGPDDVTFTVPNWSTLVVRYSSVGAYLGAQTYSAGSSVYPGCLDITDFNQVVVGGVYAGNIDFDLSPGYQNLFINSGTATNTNGFLLSLHQSDYIAIVPPYASFSANITAFCEGVCTNFQDNSLYAPDTWNWSFPGAMPATSTSQHPQNICYATPGNYNVQLIVSNPLGADTLIFTNYITVDAIPQTNAGNDVAVCEGSSLQLSGSGATVYSWSPAATLVNPSSANPIASPLTTTTYTLTGTNGSCSSDDEIIITVHSNPAAPVITPVGAELESTPAFAYQWYFNGMPVSGATLQQLFPNQIGNYSVTVFDSTGCFANSSNYFVTVVGNEQYEAEQMSFTLMPNPVGNEITIYAVLNTPLLKVSLFDIAGKLLAVKSMQFNAGLNKVDVDISTLSAGVYRVEVDNKTTIQTLKMLKMND